MSPRSQPNTAPPPPADTTPEDLAELQVLWPRLGAAIARDTAGPSAAPSDSGGGSAGRGSPSVLDLDTERVMTMIETDAYKLATDVAAQLGIQTQATLRRLHAEIEAHHRRRADARATALRVGRRLEHRAPTVDEHVTQLQALMTITAAEAGIARARVRVNEVQHSRTVDGILDRLPIWYELLAAKGDPLAARIRRHTERWRRDARQALNLATHEQKIGYTCPYHRREVKAELVRERDEAILAPAVIAGSNPRRGAPLRWRRSETVRCPHCKRRWAGGTQLRTLMRSIDRADLEDYVYDSVTKAVADELHRTKLYQCPACERTASREAWEAAWRRASTRSQLTDDELAGWLVCPHCESPSDADDVALIEAVVVALPTP